MDHKWASVAQTTRCWRVTDRRLWRGPTGDGLPPNVHANNVGVAIQADTAHHKTLTGEDFSDMAARAGWPQGTFTIFEGTSEIQRLIVARAISGLRLC